MREGNGGPKQGSVFHVAAGSDEVGGDDGLTMARFQGMHRAQPEGDRDTSNQPSSAQLRLMQKLGKVIGIHSEPYLDLAACGVLRISSKYRSTNG